jgi:hypothetical protein
MACQQGIASQLFQQSNKKAPQSATFNQSINSMLWKIWSQHQDGD